MSPKVLTTAPSAAPENPGGKAVPKWEAPAIALLLDDARSVADDGPE